MSDLPKTFSQDHVLRDRNGSPLGRAILVEDDLYREGKPFRVALLLVPVHRTKKAQALDYYVDGIRYRIPPGVPDLKIRQSEGMHRVNNFTMEPADG